MFDFWSILARKYPKIQNICLHFARQDGQDKKITKLKLPKTKRQKYENICLHFARQDGHDGKIRKENHAIKVTKIQKKMKLRK